MIYIYNFKVLSVSSDHFIGTKGYSIYKYDSNSKRVKRVGRVKNRKYAILSKCRLTRRLFRAEITNFYDLFDGNQLCIAKKGIFSKNRYGLEFSQIFSVPRGSRPLNLCITPNKDIYFGEYFPNFGKKEVNVYHSKDYGNRWNIVFTFSEGSINHVHGIFFDRFSERIWIVTGDRDNECMIAYTSDGFKTLNLVFRGGQEYRTCNLMFYSTFIVFATDSQYIQNTIKCFDRETLEIKELQKIQGSAIKGGQCGEISYISTTVEPSKVNKDKYAHLWITKDGLNWKEYYSAKKDWLPPIFQYGTIEFPYFTHLSSKFYFYGRALKKIGGHTVEIEI